MENIDASSFSCLPPCSGSFVTSFNKFQPENNISVVFPHVEAYNNYKKITKNPSEHSRGKFKFMHVMIIKYLSIKYLFIFIQNGKTIWSIYEYGLTLQQSIRSPRTEQQSLLTCCPLLVAPWDSSLASLSSVQWRFFTLSLKLSGQEGKFVEQRWM